MTQPTNEKQPPVKMFIGPRHGAEYNLESGLDWARLEAEHVAASTPEDLTRARARAKAIASGKTAAAANVIGDAAVTEAFPKDEEEE